MGFVETVLDFRVKEAMTPAPLAVINSDDTVAQAAGVMMGGKVGSLIVVDSSVPVGIITERDIVRKVTAFVKRDPAQIKISEVMSKPLIMVKPDASLTEAATLMVEREIRRVIVSDEDKLLGILTCTDFAKYLRKCAKENKLLYLAMSRETNENPEGFV